MGHLLANTLAVRNVTVVVLDVEPIITENGKSAIFSTKRACQLISVLVNIMFYTCDVSDWNQVKDVARKVVEEVS